MPVEAREVAARALVPVVGVRLGGHVRRDLDDHGPRRSPRAPARPRPPRSSSNIRRTTSTLRLGSRRRTIRPDSVPRVKDLHVHEVAIVGAGFGGLGMAIRLKQEGIDDFVLIERGADVGGTWWANSYPGCQCDIPSNLYSFSFAPNPDWTRAYPLRDEILEYLRDCAERFGVLPHTRAWAASCSAPPGSRASSAGSSRPRRGRSPRACSWPRPACSASRSTPDCPASSASRATPSTRPTGTTPTT